MKMGIGMRNKIGLAGALFALAVSVEVQAAPLKVVGFDDMSCQRWVAAKDDAEQRAAYVAWVRGVLTGHNYANQSQQVSDISNGTVENFVTRYCAQKPQGLFSDAALRLSDQFSGRNAAITK